MSDEIQIPVSLVVDNQFNVELRAEDIQIEFTEAPVIISPIEDVRYKGTSVVQNDVANIPIQSPEDILSQAQLSAVNSGITSNKVTTYDGYLALINANTSAIASEAQTRASADSVLQNNISSEATARENADSTLQNNISAEATTRNNADIQLQNNITAEASAREMADNGKVDKVTGKGLSTNDLTNELKSHYDSAYTDKHTHANKALLDTYMQTEANLADAVAKKHSHSNINVLDATQEALTTLLKQTYDGYQAQINSKQPVGDYATNSALTSGLALKQNILTAGAGIEILNDVISADTAFHAQVFQELPTPSVEYKNTVALVLKPGTSQYYQYMCTTEDQGVTWSWKQVGTTDIDLSSYKIWSETKTYIDTKDAKKVDKETGKGLSTNDYTTAEKTKLAGIANGAEVNVQSDWNVTDTSSDAYIQHKPSIPTKTSELTNDSGFLTQHQSLDNYVTLNTAQTISAKKSILVTEPLVGGGQETLFNVLSTHSTEDIGHTAMWTGRMKVGNKNKSFIIGVYRGNLGGASSPMCGLGAHSWTDSSTETGASWEDVYIQPDGDKACYIGGKDWRHNSGWLKVQNSNYESGGKVYYNKGTTVSPSWKEVAVTDVATTSSNGLMSSTDKTNLNANTTARHTHDNKSTLDSIEGTATATTLGIDSVVTSGSNNLITSGAVYTVVGNIEATLRAIRGV